MGLDRISGKKKGKWEQFLEGVDYLETWAALYFIIDFAVKGGERAGGSYCLKQKDLDALVPYMENPCYETALNLLEVTDGTLAEAC